MSRLEGKVAVISGGNIFGRRREELDKAVQLIGANVTAIRADATKLEDLDRVADAVRSAKGKVDVVVSSASLTEQVPLPEITRFVRATPITLPC